MQLPHDEAQRLIYRGCARLAQAMKVTHIAPDAAQKWEDEALREAVRDLRVIPMHFVMCTVHCSDQRAPDGPRHSTPPTCPDRGAQDPCETATNVSL